MSNIKIEESWKTVLAEEFEKPYFQKITEYLRAAWQSKEKFYPPGPLIFNAFNKTPFHHVKIVILGQDPYIHPGEAMGLSFSVPKGIKIPPSLQNIFRELHDDLGCQIPAHGDLSDWAEQGVFLLNAALTVAPGKSNSHAGIGWHTFTDAVISKISERKENVVFMLWGNSARQKSRLIDPFRHLILEAAHPSPLTGGAFHGCRHFSKANDFLIKTGQTPIDWCRLSNT